nr:serine carboxypeptidase-like 34 [Triticum aestivum]
MDNKKEACVNRHDIKEEKKKERFDIFMAAREKKINVGNQKSKLKEKKTKLEERRVEPRALQRKPKMLAIKMDELDLDVPKVVQAVLEKMLNQLPNEVAQT